MRANLCKTTARLLQDARVLSAVRVQLQEGVCALRGKQKVCEAERMPEEAHHQEVRVDGVNARSEEKMEEIEQI